MENIKKTAKLYVIATPIGNLEDISQRAIRTLKEVDILAAEDTRNTKKLLQEYGIAKKEIVSYFDHNEKEVSQKLIERILRTGETLGLVSDAGTPCISDPGYRLVALAHEKGIPVSPIPGASALLSLASAGGLPTNRILFIGFLPTKAGALAEEIETWHSVESGSIIFYESTRRLQKSLKVIEERYPEARVAVGRELTKLYEEVAVSSIKDCYTWASQHSSLKGEVAVMLHLGKNGGSAAAGLSREDIVSKAKKAFKDGETLKSLLQTFKDSGFSRTELYQILLQAKES
jgi:16S rRNA (cytidine1402-2'-O)-methyltransferase